MQTCVLKIWQNVKSLLNMKVFQYIEVLVLNIVEIPVESQDIEIFQYLEAQHHTQYTFKALV